MAIGTFRIAKAKDKSKVIKTRDALDVAARYLAYKLYEATDRQPMQWATLRGMNELRATIGRLSADGSFSRMRGVSRWTVRPR